jgi:hypothetical protein
MTRIFEVLARWRTWVFNGLLALAFIMPEILNSPEILAIIPREFQRWFLVTAFLVNIWMRPRPAVLPGDPEVDQRRDRLRRSR